MTRRSPSAERQVQLTHGLSAKINERPYLFVSDHETVTGDKIPDGEWIHRVETFLNDPESGVGSDEIEREWALAMITRRYKAHLAPELVKRLTRCLQPVKRYPPKDRQARLDKVKRDIKNV